LPSGIVLSQHEFINTTSVDETLELYARLCARVRLEPDSRTSFACRTGQVRLGSVGLLADRFEGAFRVWTADDRDDLLMMTLPIRNGRGMVAVDRDEHRLAAGQWGVIGTPMRPHAFALDSGYEALQVAFSRTDLQATASALAGLDSPPYLEFEPSIQLDSGGGGALNRFIQFVVSEVDAERGLLHSPLVVARCAEAITTQLLTGLPHKHHALLTRPGRSDELRAVRKAAEYLEAHAEQPITVADVARAVGVSVRTLQASFRKHRGTSPMTFLRDRRLDLARRRLVTAPWPSITDIALACGFDHLGRFSHLYRQRFGESPSTTRSRTFRR